MPFFTAKISKITVNKKVSDTPSQHIYRIHGQLFFAAVQDVSNEFIDVQEGSRLIIDFTEARIWDDSGAGAIDLLISKPQQEQVAFNFVGLDASVPDC